MSEGDSPDLLSPAWFEDLRRRLETIGPLGEAGKKLRLGQLVPDAPGGPVAWTLVVGGDEASRVENGVEGADVVLVEDLDVARVFSKGAASSELFYAGRVKVRGNVTALLARTDLLAELSSRLGGEEN